MIQTDQAPRPSGRVVMRIEQLGRVRRIVVGRNLVVDGFLAQLPTMVAGAGVQVARIGIGTSGTAPSAGDTSLTGGYTRAIGVATYPAARTVTFAWSIEPGEANPMQVREFGLLTAAGVLLARKVVSSAITKDDKTRITGAWTIYWS